MAIGLGTAIAYFTIDTSGFDQGLKQVQQKSESAAKKSSMSVTDAFGTVGKSLSSVGGAMTKGITVPILTAGAAAVKSGANFEYAMSQVKKTIPKVEDYKFEELTQKAREMGRETTFTATEAANALQYMGMAGWDADQMLEGLPSVLNLAIAGGTDLATTSDIVTDALTAFGLTSKDTAHFTDILAAASMSSNTNVNLLGESFRYVAPVAGAFKFTAEDTALALGLMANAGIKSSMAGTSLRSVMTNLANPVGQSKAAVEELGIEITNADGSTRSFRDIMDELRAKLGGATMPADELAGRLSYLDEQFQSGAISQEEYEDRVMGVAEAAYTGADAEKVRLAAMLAGKTGMSGLLAIVNAGQKDYNDLAKEIDNCSNTESGLGAAADMAAIAQDNFQSKVLILISKLTDLGIRIFEIVEGPLTKIIEKIGEVIDWFSGLDKGTQESIVHFLLFMAAVGPVLKFLGDLIGTVVKVKKGFTAFNTAVKVITGALGMGEGVGLLGILGKLVGFLKGVVMGAITAVVGAIGVIPAIIIAVVAGFALLLVFNEDFRNFMKEIGGHILDFLKSIPEYLGKFWNWLGDTLGDIVKSIGEWGAGLIEKAAEIGGGFVEGVLDFFKGLPEKMGEWFNKGIDKAKEFAEKFKEWGKKAGDWFKEKMEDLKDLKDRIGKHLKSAVEKAKDWAGEMKEKAKEAAKGFAEKIDEKFGDLPTVISDHLKKAIEKVKDWREDLRERAKEAGEGFRKNVIEPLKELPGNLKEKFDKGLDKAKDFGKDFIDTGVKGAQGFWNGVFDIMDGFGEGLDSNFGEGLRVTAAFGKEFIGKGDESSKEYIRRFKEGMKNLPGNLKKNFKEALSKVKELGEDALQIGKDIAGWIGNGIRSGIGAIKDAVKWIFDQAMDIVKSPTGLTDKLKGLVNPRSAGVRYVPYNNYVASLHEGEMVLTKDQAEAYRKGTGNNNQGGDTFIFNSPKQIDEREAARLLKQTKRELRLGF